MHGAVHDYLVLKTAKNGDAYQTGETHDRMAVGVAQKNTLLGKIDTLTTQPTFKRLLEIGSLDLIGSMRSYDFMGTGPLWSSLLGIEEYVGIDIMPGKSVDIVMNAHDLQFDAESFDIVICLQMLEHDDDAPKTIKEAYRVLKYGQPFFLTCASAEHPAHADLGGGSQAYIHIKQEEIREWFIDAGFKPSEIEIIKEGSNFYIHAVKTEPAKKKKVK